MNNRRRNFRSRSQKSNFRRRSGTLNSNGSNNLNNNGNLNFNRNGSMNNIAGIINKNKNILGLMPHPERAVNFSEDNDGVSFFRGLQNLL